jgi:ankyrin repeat protein
MKGIRLYTGRQVIIHFYYDNIGSGKTPPNVPFVDFLVCGEAQILRALLAAGADATIPDTNGATPLHYAAQMCGYDGKSDKASTKLALDILNILLKHSKSTVEVEDKDGRQPLMWAASAGSEDAILALIKAGAYAESSDK